MSGTSEKRRTSMKKTSKNGSATDHPQNAGNDPPGTHFRGPRIGAFSAPRPPEGLKTILRKVMFFRRFFRTVFW